jgi:hypothetical protein
MASPGSRTGFQKLLKVTEAREAGDLLASATAVFAVLEWLPLPEIAALLAIFWWVGRFIVWLRKK